MASFIGLMMMFTMRERARGSAAMTTASAIDRLVHHSVILEFGKEMPSIRAQHATERNQHTTSDDDPPMPVSS